MIRHDDIIAMEHTQGWSQRDRPENRRYKVTGLLLNGLKQFIKGKALVIRRQRWNTPEVTDGLEMNAAHSRGLGDGKADDIPNITAC